MKRIALFLLLIACTSKAFTQTKENVVSLPFELVLNENENENEILMIMANGIIEFGGNFFVYKENGDEYPIKYEVLITTYTKNNLYGINILEETEYGGNIEHTIIFDIKTKQEILYEKDEYFRFWDFFSIGNCFILASAENAYAFNDSTGELLWTQTYSQRDGKGIIINKDHFITEDSNGNKYRIYGDGQKIKL
jgi:outer membrane protein assembly factor BamB